MKICEVCGKEHDGSYGSGRFCSKHCRMSYINYRGLEKRRKNGTLGELMAKARSGITRQSYLNGIATKKNRYPNGIKIIDRPACCQFCGKICKNSISLSNHQRICKNNPNRQISNIEKYNQTNHVPWNKGLTKETSESVARNAIGAKNAANREEHKSRMREFNKKYWTEERRKAKSEEKKRLYAEHPEKHPNRKLANNKKKMSYPEQVAYTWLVEHKISFEHQKRFGKYFADFYVYDKKLVIEIDGERWHDVNKDKIRDSWIVDNFQVQIVRIPTNEKIIDRLNDLFK